MKEYLRPLGLVFGHDARTFVAAGEAGQLGGLSHVAFTHVEYIERANGKISRKLCRFRDLADHARMAAHTTPRPAFGLLRMDTCRIMGIVNVTPDSFSDGGAHSTAQAAIAHAKQLAAEGADILDVGGESTRPGSDTVEEEEECNRILPVISALTNDGLISADTRKASVMRKALQAGATIINDVSALRHDAASAGAVAMAGCPVVLMHAQGEPKTMQLNPIYEDVVLDVYDALEQRVAAAEAAGVSRSNICVDPGIGFGKTFAQNLALMAGLTVFHGLGLPLLVGLSRKGFVGAVTREKLAKDRAMGSVGGALQAAQNGAHILRVHDVKATRQALAMFTASNDPDSSDI